MSDRSTAELYMSLREQRARAAVESGDNRLALYLAFLSELGDAGDSQTIDDLVAAVCAKGSGQWSGYPAGANLERGQKILASLERGYWPAIYPKPHGQTLHELIDEIWPPGEIPRYRDPAKWRPYRRAEGEP